MRCPRCGSAKGEDFFQNTQRQPRSFGVATSGDGGGGMGSYGIDESFWTCKKCMVRLVSDTAYERQQESARFIDMTPEEKQKELIRKYGEPKQHPVLSGLWAIFLISGLIFSVYVFITL